MIENSKSVRLGVALKENKFFQVAEIILPFLLATIIIVIGKFFVGEDPILNQMVVWVSNIVMLCVVWVGLKARDEKWLHIGLSLKHAKLRTFLLSLAVFIAALAGFMFGAVIMANITGIPESADMSSYNALAGNLPLLIVALIAVFIASSFGEEVIYRGFLITRISELGGNSKTWIRLAVVISSIIFGLIHYDWGAMGMVQTGFMGLALGVSFLLVKRNLWTLVLAHAYLDAILMIQIYMGGN